MPEEVNLVRGKKLTPKQARFVEEYLVDLNATNAAKRAGYAAKTSYSFGQRLLKNVEVQNAINVAQRRRSIRTEISQDAVIKEIAKIAFGDPRAVMSWGPDGVKLKDSKEISDDAAAFVAEVSESTTESGGSLRLKTNDKLKALELLGKHFGMFKEQQPVQQSTNNLIFADSNALIYQAVLDTVRDTARAVREGAVLSGDPVREGDITEV